jgi:tetratricopeptide (TPR) repeat protein
MCEQIRKIRKDYTDVGNILNALGIAHGKRRSFKKASRCLLDSLAIRKTMLGDMHPEVAETYHNLGNCSAKQGDFDNALIYYEQSLIIKKMNYGDTESTATTIQTIGMVNEEQGMLDNAFGYYQEALNIRMNKLGANHLECAFSLHRYVFH